MIPISAFVFQNFSLFGFDCPMNSLTQLIIELVDNSVDACRIGSLTSQHITIPKVRVTIKSQDDLPNLLLIEISDTGIGMEDPETLFACFSTTRHSETFDQSLIGKFGVGLSVSIMYSYHITNQPARLATFSHQSKVLQAADIILNEDGIPKFINKIQKQEISTLPTFGTLIRLYMPVITQLEFSTVKESLLKYFSLLTMLMKPRIIIEFELKLDVEDRSFQEQHVFPKEFMPSTSSLSDKRTLQIGLLDLYPNYWCKDLSISQLTVEQESDEITIMVAFLDEKDNAEVNQIEDTESFSNIWDHYELEVLRFVNCKPLGNRYSNPLELSCDLIQSIRSFQWKNFCFKVGSIFLEEYCKIFLQPIESRFQHNHMHICPRKHKVVLGIHLQSNQVQFSDFRKDCIRGLTSSHKDQIKRGLITCLEEIKSSNHICRSWPSRESQKESYINSIVVPTISRSIFDIVRHSQNKDFQEWIQQHFQLSTEGDNNPSEEFIQDIACRIKSAILK